MSRSELFEGLSRAQLAEIEGQLTPQTLPAGAVLFAQGDRGDAAYLVVEGALELRVGGIALMQRGAGECVGEFALIDDEPRSADAVAVGQVSLLRWERADFQHSVARDPRVARGIFRMLTRKLRSDTEQQLRMQLERERWRQDMLRAREIQAAMLPPSHWVAPGAEISGFCEPAAGVGGDYFDYLALREKRLGIVIGDVTGHGFYSGLFVAMAKSCLHTFARYGQAPSEVMGALRRALELSVRRRLLMTCCYVLLDPGAGRLRYANAGHPYPYLWSARERSLERLEALDPLLGALDLEQSAFDEGVRGWHTGDLLVLYSDGVTEARDASGAMFGHERLERCIELHVHEAPGRIRDTILDQVAQHVGSREPDDDLTLVVARAT